MIRTLTIDNYRSFEAYEVRDLARVNLLVGPNNCGKTTVLEAVELLASGGHPEAMFRSSSRREEPYSRRTATGDATRYLIRHHFRDFRVAPGVALGISSDDSLGGIEFRVREVVEEDPPWLSEPEIADADLRPSMQPMVLELRRLHDDGPAEETLALRLMDDGSLDWQSTRLRRFRRDAARAKLPILFVTTDLRGDLELKRAWNQIVMEGQAREREIEEVMRIIAPKLGSIRFLADHGREGLRGSATAGAVASVQADGPRIPIGSHGEGMRRLLALSLALDASAGGFLVVDEIDKGLHWTALEDLWKLILETATRYSVQVFATTHSLDCILGLARLLKGRPDLWESVSIQKIERRLTHSVSFDAEAILAAANHSIELRS